jgi:hypothetical protein
MPNFMSTAKKLHQNLVNLRLNQRKTRQCMTRIKQRKNWQRAHMVCVRRGWRFVGAQHTRVLGVRWWCARVFKAFARVFKHNLQYHINAALRAPPSSLLCAEFIPRSKRFCIRHLALSIFLRPVSHTI